MIAADNKQQSIISNVIESGCKLVPDLKIRFAEAIKDELGTAIKIGLKLPEGITTSSDETYHLHQLGVAISEQENYSVTISTSPFVGGGTLLLLNFLKPEYIAEEDYIKLKSEKSIPEKKSSAHFNWIGLAAFVVILLVIFWKADREDNIRQVGLVQNHQELAQSGNNSQLPPMAYLLPKLSSADYARQELILRLSDYINKAKELQKTSPREMKRIEHLEKLRELLEADHFFKD